MRRLDHSRRNDAGFDEIPEAVRSQPPLTTVRHSLVDKGTVAGEHLFALLQGNSAPDTVLPLELQMRESTGPAAHSQAA